MSDKRETPISITKTELIKDRCFTDIKITICNFDGRSAVLIGIAEALKAYLPYEIDKNNIRRIRAVLRVYEKMAKNDFAMWDLAKYEQKWMRYISEHFAGWWW